MGNKGGNQKVLKVLLKSQTEGVDKTLDAIKELQSGVESLTKSIGEFIDAFKTTKSVTENLDKEFNTLFKSLSKGTEDFKKNITSTIDGLKEKLKLDDITKTLDLMSSKGLKTSKLFTDLNSLKDVINNLSDKYTKKFNSELGKLKDKFDGTTEGTEEYKKTLIELKNTIASQVTNEVEKLTNKQSNLLQKISETNGTVSAASEYWKKFGERIRTYIDYRVINNVFSAMKNLTKAAIDLESSFANIQAITSASDVEMEKLRNTILKVGEASKYSVEEISDATVILGQAGLSASEINNVLETTTQLAAGTGSSLSNTIDLMTSALAVWGLNSEEASHLSDVMVTGMNRTKATLDTFRMAVQYAGATMASLNVNFDEFSSVAAAAANAGIKASVVGTGLRAVASELISPTTKMVNGLAKLGLTTEDVNIESNGLVNVLYKLKNAGLDASNAYSLFGRRAAQFILAAQGQLDVVDDLQLAFVESGATLKAYNTQMNTVAAEWTALANTIKEASYNILNETDGFIKGILSLTRKGIRKLFFDEIDDIKDEIKDVDNKINNLGRYSELAERYRNTNYNGNTEKQLGEFNNLANSLNKVYGLNIDVASSVENITDKYDELIRKVEEFRKAAYAEREQKRKEGIDFIRDQHFNEVNTEVANTFAENLSKYNNRNFLSLFGHFGKLDELWRPGEDVDQKIEDNIHNLVLAGEDYLTEYNYILETRTKEFEKNLEELKRKLESGEIDNGSFNIAADALNYQYSMFKESLKVAKEAVENNFGELKNYEQDKLFEDKMKEISKEYSKIQSDINKVFADTEENKLKLLNKQFVDLETGEVEVVNTTADVINKNKEQLNTDIENFKKILDGLSDEQKKLLGDKKLEDLNKKIIELETKLNNSLSDFVKSKIDQVINWFSTKFKDKRGEIEALQKAKADSVEGAIASEIAGAKLSNKLETQDRRSIREIERDKAREFNKRYQNLKLQAQADSYAQDIAEARRKGVVSKLNTRDTTGTLASYYSRTAADLSKLESLKTAIANKETLEKYKNDRPGLFEQVTSGKVNLEDADNKTAGLIKEMMDLDKNVKAAEAEFGNLNDVDLSDLNGQITTLQDKLKEIEESGESEFDKLKKGFKGTIESMSKEYGSAKLGATIAEDLGNGVSDALYSIADGTKTAKEAFSDMARSILEDISKMLIKMAVLKAMEGGMSLLPGFSDGGSIQPETQGQLMLGAEYAKGGFIPKIRAALGTSVRGGIQGKDSVPAMLMPGEYVLKKSAVDALGTNFLNDLNNNAAQTLTNTASSLMTNSNESKSESEPAVVNVWVVSKEEEAQMGPNDIIATVSKDIMTGGTTRRLIQQVVAGRK